MNDHQLDERLTRAGERFRANPTAPPTLESMLEVAMRPRHRARLWLPVAASVLAVAGIAVAVPLTRSSQNVHPSSTAAVPPTIKRDDTTLYYVGDESWKDPVLDESSPNTVYIYAEVQPGGTASWGSYCGVDPVARIVSQTATAVTIAVGRYAAPPTTPSPGARIGCTDVKLPPAKLKLVLTQPLHTRSLIDAQDGAARQVLDPATVLKPTYLPAGYTGGQATWNDDPVSGSTGNAVRIYSGQGSMLTITVGPAPLPQRAAHIIERTTVRGHPATVSYSPGFEEDILIAWNEDPTHAANLYQMSTDNQSHPALTAQQLLRIADSLR